jgi:hypothetical protein
LNVALAVSWFVPGTAPAGTLTCQVVVAVWPGFTCENVVGEVAVTVQPLGALSETFTFASGWLPVSGRLVVTETFVPGPTMDGAFTVNGCRTAMGAEPVTPLTVTLIVDTPWPTAVTFPALLTVATPGLLLL